MAIPSLALAVSRIFSFGEAASSSGSNAVNGLKPSHIREAIGGTFVPRVEGAFRTHVVYSKAEVSGYKSEIIKRTLRLIEIR